MNNNSKYHPPRFFEWLLSKMLTDYNSWALLGDLEEEFYEILESKGPNAARWFYIKYSLKTIPKSVIHFIYWTITISGTYLKLAFRILIKNKTVSIINISGLAIAIGIAIISIVFVDYHYNRDSFHVNRDNIFMVYNTVNQNGTEQQWADCPAPLGPRLSEDFNSIEQVVRLKDWNAKIRFGDNVFNENILFADEGFFKMFTFPLQYGIDNPLSRKNSVVLSKDIAIKYFGGKNPVGEVLTVFFHDNQTEMFVVTGVAEKFPDNASFAFNFLFPYQNAYDLKILDEENWKERTRATFVLVKNPGDIENIQTNSRNYLDIQNFADADRKMTGLFYKSLNDLADDSYDIYASIVTVKFNTGQLLFMIFLGSAFLGLACFNYMNISISSSVKRFKEIGIRKVLGSDRKKLVYQFVTENFLLCMIALITGYLLAHFIILPWMNGIFYSPFKSNIFENYILAVYLLALLFAIVIVCGLYPALYISSFSPTSIFKEKKNIGGSGRITKILLGMQLGISLLCLSSGIIFIENNEYQSSRDWGFDKDGTICIPLENSKQFEVLRNEIAGYGDIKNLAGSSQQLSYTFSNDGVEVNEKKYTVEKYDVGFNYLETYGFELQSGRFFDRNIKSDIENSVIVNETFVNTVQWKDPINREIVYNDKPYYVIGVLKDYHTHNFLQKIVPVIQFVKDDSVSWYLNAAFGKGTGISTIRFIEKKWKELFPNSPFLGFFQKDLYSGYLNSMRAMGEFSTSMALIALLITCMGILGTISMNISAKMKEMGIRKVLGASNLLLAGIINKSFIKTMIFSSVLSFPVVYYLMISLMDALWEYHHVIDAVPFLVSILILFLSALLTLSFRTYKAVKMNPADIIKTE